MNTSSKQEVGVPPIGAWAAPAAAAAGPGRGGGRRAGPPREIHAGAPAGGGALPGAAAAIEGPPSVL